MSGGAGGNIRLDSARSDHFTDFGRVGSGRHSRMVALTCDVGANSDVLVIGAGLAVGGGCRGPRRGVRCAGR